MAQPPILKTMDDMLAKLSEAVRINRESETAIREYSKALRALAQVCEDEEMKTHYLLALEEATGKGGFMEAVRTVFRNYDKIAAISPAEIKALIYADNIMDLSAYSNPMASIHTTLRRMKDKGELEEATNAKGDKAYRLSKAQIAMREAMSRRKK